jgi:hypothetical protein
MADYTVDIGGSSSMMIRDTGSWVEFWFKTGAQTWNNDQQWSFSANGSYSGTREYRLLRGGNWQQFGSVRVTYDQNVQFTIYNAGLGFPTHTFTQHIQRSTVPQPPTLRSATPISANSIRVIFQGNYHGGSPVVEWQIGYGSSSNGPTALISSDGSTDVGGFNSGQKVYFWARGRNALGWSGWSNRGEATTWQVPAAPGKPVFYDVKQTSLQVLYLFSTRSNDPPFLESQFGYSQNPLAVVYDEIVNAPGGLVEVDDLHPGGTYYFWARSRNAVGWGNWSVAAKVVLNAGARVLVGGQWKRAVPYIRIGGTWKVAEPWVRRQGVWKRTSQ